MKLKITVDNKTYEVDVEAAEPELPSHAPKAYSAGSAVHLPAAGAASRQPQPSQNGPVNEAKVCRSPIAGIVVKVAAQVGQQIQSGDVLMVLEAMKMETNITAPAAGKISAVPVKSGDGVQSGQVVVELE